MFTFFKKKEMGEVFAFVSGKIKPLEEVPDAVFSKGLIGPGIAITPIQGNVVAPINGEITMLFPTKHALGIKGEDGMEILLHIGIDTVTLKGEGFSALVKEKQRVKAGEPLIFVDLDLLQEKQLATDVMCIITNPIQACIEVMQDIGDKVVAGEDTVLKVKGAT